MHVMKVYGDVFARVHIATATAPLGRGRVASPTFGPGKAQYRYSLYRRVSGPQDQSGHEGMEKNLHPSVIQDRIRAIQPVTKRLLLELPL